MHGNYTLCRSLQASHDSRQAVFPFSFPKLMRKRMAEYSQEEAAKAKKVADNASITPEDFEKKYPTNTAQQATSPAQQQQSSVPVDFINPELFNPQVYNVQPAREAIISPASLWQAITSTNNATDIPITPDTFDLRPTAQQQFIPESKQALQLDDSGISLSYALSRPEYNVPVQGTGDMLSSARQGDQKRAVDTSWMNFRNMDRQLSEDNNIDEYVKLREQKLDPIAATYGLGPDLVPYSSKPPNNIIGNLTTDLIAGVADTIIGNTAKGASWMTDGAIGADTAKSADKFMEVLQKPRKYGLDIDAKPGQEGAASSVAQSLPFTLATIPVAMAGGAIGAGTAATLGMGRTAQAIGGLVGGAVPARFVEALTETGGFLEEARNEYIKRHPLAKKIDQGYRPTNAEINALKKAADKYAKDNAWKVFAGNMGLSVVDAAQFGAVFAPQYLKQLTKIKGLNLPLSARVAATMLFEAGSEGYEEVVQKNITNFAMDKPLNLNPVSPENIEEFGVGAVMGGIFGGAGMITDKFNRDNLKEARKVSYSSLQDLQTRYNEAARPVYENAIANGATHEQAMQVVQENQDIINIRKEQAAEFKNYVSTIDQLDTGKTPDEVIKEATENSVDLERKIASHYKEFALKEENQGKPEAQIRIEFASDPKTIEYRRQQADERTRRAIAQDRMKQQKEQVEQQPAQPVQQQSTTPTVENAPQQQQQQAQTQTQAAPVTGQRAIDVTLKAIEENDGITVEDIQKKTELDPATIFTVLNDLSTSGTISVSDDGVITLNTPQAQGQTTKRKFGRPVDITGVPVVSRKVGARDQVVIDEMQDDTAIMEELDAYQDEDTPPWTMTQREYLSTLPAGANTDAAKNVHKKSIIDAIANGENVAQRVVAEYDDLFDILPKAQDGAKITIGSIVETNDGPVRVASINEKYGTFDGILKDNRRRMYLISDFAQTPSTTGKIDTLPTENKNDIQQSDFVKDSNSLNSNPTNAMRGAHVQKYPGMIRIGAVNSMQRRNNPGTPLEIQQINNANYVANPINEQGVYEVVPKVGLVYDESTHGHGGGKELFDIPDLETREYENTQMQKVTEMVDRSYEDLYVVEPALVRKTDKGFEIMKKGLMSAKGNPNVKPVAKTSPNNTANTGVPNTDKVQLNKEPVNGNTVTLRTDDGTEFEARYKVVSANNIVSSQNTDGTANKNYPQELQPRNRTGRVFSSQQITGIVNGLRPADLGSGRSVNQGAPLVNASNVVENGNGRIVAIKTIYETNHPNAEKYKKWLIDNAESFGLSPEEIANIKNPVLVRERITDIPIDKIINSTEGGAMLSGSEQATMDSNKITQSMLDMLEVGNNGIDLLSAANRDFVQSFVQNVVSKNEQNSILDKDGNISINGVRRIQNALFAKAYGDALLLGRMAESTDNNVKNITNALLTVAPRIAKIREGVASEVYYPLDISGEIITATNTLSNLRDIGKQVELYVSEQSLFGGEISGLEQQILLLFDRNKQRPKTISGVLNNYCDIVEQLGSPRQNSLWESKEITKDEAFDRAKARVTSETTEQTDLFGNRKGRVETGTTGETDGKTQDGTGDRQGNGSLLPGEKQEEEVIPTLDSIRATYNAISKAFSKLPEYEITQTKHTKTGEDIFVVKIKKKLNKDEYEAIKKEMKRIGGSYSRFTHGFNFSVDPRLSLAQQQSNTTDTSNAANPKLIEKIASWTDEELQRRYQFLLENDNGDTTLLNAVKAEIDKRKKQTNSETAGATYKGTDFIKGDRVEWTDNNGNKLSGTVGRDGNNRDGYISVNTDQVAKIGTVPIDRIELVWLNNNTLRKIEATTSQEQKTTMEEDTTGTETDINIDLTATGMDGVTSLKDLFDKANELGGKKPKKIDAEADALLDEFFGELNNLNSTPMFNPKLIEIGFRLGLHYLKKGFKKLVEWKNAILTDARAKSPEMANAIEPYLDPIYESITNFPEGQEYNQELAKTIINASGVLYQSGAKDKDVLKANLYKYLDKEIADAYIDSVHAALSKWPGLNGGKQEDKATPQSAYAVATGKVASWVRNKLNAGEQFTWQELFAQSDNAFGGTQNNNTYTPKDAWDAMELGINQYIAAQNDINPSVNTASAAQRVVQTIIDNILTKIPTQSKRTAEQDEFQQFSTPPNIAYIAAWVGNVNANDTVLEPSAGIGGLAVFADKTAKEVIANELSPRRLDIIKQMGFDQTLNENAEQINNILPADIKPTVVIMNPPFSSTAGRTQGKNSNLNVLPHIEQALKRLQPGGRLVAIVGRGMSEDAATFRDWWKRTKEQYNVRANIGIDGTNYAKYGTSFDIQLLVIDKTGSTTDSTLTDNYTDLEEVLTALEGIRNDRQRTMAGNEQTEQDTRTQQDSEKMDGEGGGATGRDGWTDGIPTDQVGTIEPGSLRGGQSGNAGTTGTGRGGRVSSKSGKGTRNTANSGRRQAKDGNDRVGTEEPGDAGGRGVEDDRPVRYGDDETITVENKENDTTDKELTDAVYEGYVPEKLRIQGAMRHPSELVQSSAMAAVSPPDITYTPNLPTKVITQGILSDAQLEAVVYAGQAQESILPDGRRKGFFIGDGTGLGKGREIAGIILDSFRQGRKKAVWISKNQDLFVDAKRDTTAVLGNSDNIFPHSKIKADSEIQNDSGILFTTYDTVASGLEMSGEELRNKTGKSARIDQIVSWLGKDFDGVIAFDEAHMMQNCMTMKTKRGKSTPAVRAIAGVELQKRLPKARIIYVSATGATEVRNLVYADRLGLWGEGTPFPKPINFVSDVEAGGVSAMELIARDMKSMGLYIARSLSFDGVTYGTLEHNLTETQRDIYNTLARSWQAVLQNIQDALAVTNGSMNSNARKNAAGQFWSSQQRFFNQVITSLQMPSVLEDIKKQVADGNSVVLQLVNTNEASQNREAAKKQAEGGTLDEVDLTPREMLMRYLEKSFPVHQYETYTDDKGNLVSRLVTAVFVKKDVA